MIEIRDLTKTFGPVKAIDGLTIDFSDGVTGLVGENGAGKSTLFRLISGVLIPDSGSIAIDGFPAESKEAKEKLFFLTDDPYFPSGADLKGVADFYGCFYKLDRRKFEFLSAGKFGLPQKGRLSTFSKGMRRRAFIALAISIDAKYYLMDEAFDGLDPIVIDQIKSEIVNLSLDGKAVVISSHNITTLERLVDKTVILYKGRLTKEGEQGDLGQELAKYQIVADAKPTREALEDKGLSVVSLKSVGSVIHLVIVNEDGAEEKIKEIYHPTICERIPIDPDEVVLLEMLLAKKEGGEVGNE